MDRLTTIPPSEMTATSVVPPPMSTMSDPDGSLTGRPAPMAADFGHARGNAHQDAGAGNPEVPIVHLLDEVPDHLLGHVEVADNAVAQRADGDDVGRGAPHHSFGLRADGQHPLGPGVHGHDRRLADHDPPMADGD
jgi:hypothetical protein